MHRYIFLNIILFLSFFLFVEVTARVYYALTRDEGGFFRDPLFVTPWFTTLDRPAPDLEVINGQLVGLFKHETAPIPARKPAGVTRIIALGGSTTKNTRTWNNAKLDYTSVLEKLLESSHDRIGSIEVFNAGSEGYSSAHSLVNLALRVREFEPDLVIVMHNANDRSVAYFGETTLPDYANKYMHPTYLAPDVQVSRGIYGLLVQSRVLSYLGIAKLFAPRETNVHNSITDVEKYFRRNIRDMIELTRGSGIEILFLTQPYRKNPGREAIEAHQELFNATIINEAGVRGGNVFDMAEKFGHDPIYFVDDLHYSAAGVRWFAEILAPQVARILSLEPGVGPQ